MANSSIQDKIKKACEEMQTITIKQFEYDESGHMVSKEVPYVTVNERLKAYRKVFPLTPIETEIIETPNSNYITIRAKVYSSENKLLGTGIATEKMQLNATETCETSAIGRALSFAGFNKSDHICSFEEISRNENPKVEINKPTKENGLSKNNQNWLDKIKTNSEVWLNEYLYRNKKKGVDELNIDEVKKMIESYKKISGASK